jgi:hypothetical protein
MCHFHDESHDMCREIQGCLRMFGVALLTWVGDDFRKWGGGQFTAPLQTKYFYIGDNSKGTIRIENFRDDCALRIFTRADRVFFCERFCLRSNLKNTPFAFWLPNCPQNRLERAYAFPRVRLGVAIFLLLFRMPGPPLRLAPESFLIAGSQMMRPLA